jgi:hypothetical protein
LADLVDIFVVTRAVLGHRREEVLDLCEAFFRSRVGEVFHDLDGLSTLWRRPRSSIH